MEVAEFKGADSGHQAAQGPGEGMRKKKHEPAADQRPRQTQQEQITIQLVEESPSPDRRNPARSGAPESPAAR